MRRRAAASLVLLAALACDSTSRLAGVGRQPDPDTRPRFPGFDIGVYPGDALLSAWRFPTSPYYWVGYYLAAPCHRDVTWMGKYAGVTSRGWGTLLIYVGQQDWARIPNEAAASRSDVLSRDTSSTRSGAAAAPSPLRDSSSSSRAVTVTCSASLLSAAQGALEGADAIAKAQSEGFPLGSSIFLDVEYVTEVAPPLRDYVSAWVSTLLTDGRYMPAVYAAKSNASALYAVALASFSGAHRSETPQFWIASSAGFSISGHPADVGFPFAAVWQGRFDVGESWGGVAATIDVDVATTPSPSAPPGDRTR